MGCVMSACGGLNTRNLASDEEEENHYGERRANGKQGVGDIANKCELTRGTISDQESEIDQTVQSLHCDPQMSIAEAAYNTRAAGGMSGEHITHLRAASKRKREVRSARGPKREAREDSRTLRIESRKRTNNLSTLLLAIVSRGRRHSTTRIDVTRNSPADPNFQLANQPPVIDRALTKAPVRVLRPNSPAPEMVQSGEHSPNRPASGSQLAVSHSTPTIELDSGQQAERARSNSADDEVSLFTSMHQLCFEIINCKLIGSSASLCLFVFGRPGSSRGELAFELVEHSPLVDFITVREISTQAPQKNETSVRDNACPLYHYLDVSSLIVANIDTRIREYNRLVAQTLRSRRQQLVSGGGETSTLESRTSNKSQEENEEEEEEEEEGPVGFESENISESLGQDDEEDESHTTNSRSDLGPATTSKELPSQTADNDRQQENGRAVSDQFGLTTLSTKQRSILQLKMIKYARCVTAKWVIHLLKREIAQLDERLARVTRDERIPPRRVYLVNLVPNQLSLFKTCLYLQQSLPLGQLRMPHWAVKFERRTNIKLMMNKERATALASSTIARTTGDQHHSITLANPTGKRVLVQFKRFSQIKLPTILAIGAQAATPDTMTPKDINNAHTSQPDQPAEKNIGSVAANLLAVGPNEKLGPKYNDLFAHQFDTLNRLTRLRYNPTRNYNYSDEHERENLLAQDSDVNASPSPTNEPLPSPTIIRDSCYLKLSHLIDFEHHHEPASPSSMSQVSSQANSQLMASSERGAIHLSSLHSHKPSSTGQLLVSPSPCPSSVASDESSPALSYDFGGHHQRRQLSPAHTTSGGHFRFPTTTTTCHHQTGPQHALKWAVELELVDEQTGGSNKWYHNQAGPTCFSVHAAPPAHVNPLEISLAPDCCLHVYHNDKRPTRSRSHASLLAPSSSTSVAGTICQAENYHLVATRVAYATGKSQTVLEVKRLHRRVIKSSGSRADTIKLRKLIGKACACLARDLDTWLRACIFDHQLQSPSSSTKHHGTNHSAKSIALITYTMRVDVSKFVAPLAGSISGHTRGVLIEQQYVAQQEAEVPRLTFDKPHASTREHLEPGPGSDPIVQLLQTQPKRSNLAKQRPASARPLSDTLDARQQVGRAVSPDGLSLQLPGALDQDGNGQGDCSTRSSSPRPRHVQFKLGQAPLTACDGSNSCTAQRRVWMRDNLFASSNESRLFSAMDSLVAALKSLDNE